MKALGLDTSTRAGSVGLACGAGADDASLTAQMAVATTATHSVRLLDTVGALLAAAGLGPTDLDVIAVASGPGSFTGLRIGMATAKGLGLALGCPVTGFSTLEATALAVHGYSGGSPICVVMDAGRGEVYRGLYAFEQGRPRRLVPDAALAPTQAVADLPESCLLSGDAALLCYPLLPSLAPRVTLCPESPAIGATLARLALRQAAELGLSGLPPLVPHYLRPADAELAASRTR